jgi:signal transduction histidine kinase
LNEKKDRVFFTVADTGYGIPAAQQAKIFGRMFRADNAKVMRSGGSGLGLYVVKSILDQAGWGIRFESQEEKGTTFYVDIPLTGMARRDGQTKLTRGIV